MARELNERGVACPAEADQARNPHRAGEGWIARTVGMILENPRYTGRQVWNRQTTKGHGPGGRAGGRGSGVVRANSVQEWEVSERLSHMPLVNETTFNGYGPRGPRRPMRRAGMRWPGWWCVASVVVGWTRTGCTAARGIAVVMATPPPHRGPIRRHGMSMSVRTISGTPYPGCSASKDGNHPMTTREPRSVNIPTGWGWKSCAATETGRSSRCQPRGSRATGQTWADVPRDRAEPHRAPPRQGST
ncbi:recombinase family protein [Saccharopolyspora sp. S2-29]|uniref:Recombinase family protein n=1 Tax=Saccharopolyspora mangrovi TaxID=3082379 RepID=A0ABU6ALU9_9PSEU|nr:recombinase family protein [Saccharopolyspora sp. S2-29]MEB3372418.1 recombinase family protein [Saccharopolyspora sp. S2-29]